MNKNRKRRIWILMICAAGVFATVTTPQASNIEVWATDPSGIYPVVLATTDWVLIGTTFGENFEENYTGQNTLEDFLLASILEIFPSNSPKVGVFSGGDSSDVAGMTGAMEKFLSTGLIASYNQFTVNQTFPLDNNLASLLDYDVVVLDPTPYKYANFVFPVTENARNALGEYLRVGGKIVASAHLFVEWTAYTSWQRKLFNEELMSLFGGVRPDINVFSDRAITSSPFSSGEEVKTYNAVNPNASSPSDPYFQFFWKLEIPIVEGAVRIEPETLNLKSKGVFTAFITLPEGYDVADININSVSCEGAPAIRANIANDTLEVKFSREDLMGVDTGDEVSFTVTGSLSNGTPFSGTDTIRIID
jgi:hypothetical protein